MTDFRKLNLTLLEQNVLILNSDTKKPLTLEELENLLHFLIEVIKKHEPLLRIIKNEKGEIKNGFN